MIGSGNIPCLRVRPRPLPERRRRSIRPYVTPLHHLTHFSLAAPAHDIGQQGKGARPGSLHLRRPRRSEFLLERPQQSRTNGVVVAVRDSVLRMAPAQICKGRNKRVQIIEPMYNDCQCLDDLSALLCQVGGPEERPRRCVNLEKPVVEQARRRICHRSHFSPSLFHECFLFRRHSMLPAASLILADVALMMSASALYSTLAFACRWADDRAFCRSIRARGMVAHGWRACEAVREQVLCLGHKRFD